MKKYLIFALIAGFTFVTLVAYKEARPTPKAPIYKEIKEYSPYYREKRFGGFQIKSKIDDEFKEKPTNMKVFHRMDELDQEWAKTHIKRVENSLIVFDNNGTEVATIAIKTKEDNDFVHSFFGI
jgi:hypothetical protein